MTEEKRVISEPFTWSRESELENRLKEADEVIKFYGNKDNWIDFSKCGPRLYFKAEEPKGYRSEGFCGVDPVGGERAREYFKKYGGENV